MALHQIFKLLISGKKTKEKKRKEKKKHFHMYRTLLKCISTLQVEKALGSLLSFHQVDFSICFKF